MATKIILKKSAIAAKTPTTGDLDYGELAINYLDGVIHFKNSSNVIKKFLDSSGSVQLSRDAISVTDNGGDGALTYSAATGIISYTGPSAAQVRAHLVAGTGITYDSASGVIAATGGGGGANVTISETAPAGASETDLWWNRTIGNLFIYYTDSDATSQWVEASPATIADSSVGSTQMIGGVQLTIYDSVGVPLKTLYGASS